MQQISPLIKTSLQNYSSTKMIACLFYYYFLFILVLASQVAGLNCTGTCGNGGPDIRFPFRIKDRQPENCGHPGFDLSCSESNHTVLELPNALKVQIERIDYRNQVIYASDPKGCFLRQRLDFRVFASPFQINEYMNDYTLFNCSSAKDRLVYNKIPCLSTLDREVCAYDSHNLVGTADLLSCTKMYDVFSVPYMLIEENYTLPLSWSNPKCGHCEAEGKGCRFRDNTTGLETECYYVLHGNSKGLSRKQISLDIGLISGFALFIAIVLVVAFYRVYKKEREYEARVESFLDDYKALNPTRYTYTDLKKMTNQFKDELGQGSYGTVFKGKLTSEIPVAVKVLNNSTGNGEEFVNEMGTMAKIHHVNVVRLIGFCADGFRRALVYEYLPNDSLQKFISSADAGNHFLGWERLNHIALGIAKGIEYLHQGCDQRILHFDIKPHNILLDDEFNPKIADFGLAKLCSKDKSAVSMTTARGTIGYIAPEVFSRNFGNVSYKSDVYSFGMLLLEMVAGRKNVDDTAENDDQIYFPQWIYNLLEEGEDLRFDIADEGDAKIAKKLAIVGLWCIQWNPADRPSMKTAVQMLEGEGYNLTKPPNPFSSTNAKKMNTGVHGRRLQQALEVIAETD